MEFKSGMLGCLICVLALMGSILAGFVMDVDATTQQTTAYDYVTDVTGLFSTTSSPEYIEYSPSTNFVGYTEQSVNYVDSTTPNAYRYVANSGLIRTQSLNIEDSMHFDWSTAVNFDASTQYRPVVINYTGSSYNLGTATNFNGINYNIVASTGNNGIPKMTSLWDILYGSGLISTSGGTITISNSGYPLIAFPSNYMTTSGINYRSDGIYLYSITGGDELIPDRFVISGTSSVATVNAYRGTTLLWTSDSVNTYIIYDYGTIENGTYTHRNINTALNGIRSRTWTMTLDTPDYKYFDNTTEYTNPNNHSIYILYTGSTYDFGLTQTLVSMDTPETISFNIETTPNSTDNILGITTAQKMFNTIRNFSTDYYDSYTLSMTDQNLPLIIFPKSYIVNVPYLGNKFSFDDSLICDYYIFDETNHQLYIAGYKNNTQQWRLLSTDMYVAYLYKHSFNTTDQNYIYPSSINTTTLTLTGTNTTPTVVNIGSSSSYSFTTNKTFPLEPPTIINILYSGTDYTLGSPVTTTPITYNGALPNFVYAGGGESHEYHPIHTLSAVLNKFNPTGTEYEAEIDIAHGSTPIFFCYTTPTQYTYSFNDGTIQYRVASVNDDNVPDRIIWDIQTGYVTIYKGGDVVFTGPSNNVLVIWDWEGIAPGTYDPSATMQATIVNSGTEVTKTITNDSTLPANPTKFIPAEDSYTYIYLTGTEYDLQGIYNNNIGKTYNIIVVPESTGGTGPHGQPTYTPKITRLTDIISTMNLSSYNEVELNINQNGDYPVIFYYENNWISFERSVGYVQSRYYYAQMGLPNLPTKMVYSVPTNTVTLYRGNIAVYSGLTDNVDIIYTYVASTSDGMDNVSTSVTLSGVGKPIPSYAYMQPEKGVTLRGVSTLWSNGYENNIIDIMVCRETTNANNLTITAGSSYITISTQNNRMNVLLHNHNGTTTTQYIGMWPAAQIEINANEGSVSLTPLGGLISYTNPVDTNNTTITWHDWYDGGTITELTLSTSSTSMRFSVTRTTVFLDTYGVVMSNPTIDISDYFPEYTDYRLNFYSFALIGDSITVNGNTYDVGDDQKITVTDPETGDSITGTLNNVYVTETDGHTYFTFANSKETVDLGETTTHTVSFGGMWYFTTGFYNAVDAIEEVYNWNLDGAIHANLTQIMLIFIGLLLVGLVTVKKVLGFSFLSIDGIVIISAIVIGLIIAGGTL